MDGCFEAVRVEEVELAVGDEAADLEDVVCFWVEAGHLGCSLSWSETRLCVMRNAYLAVDPDQGVVGVGEWHGRLVAV